MVVSSWLSSKPPAPPHPQQNKKVTLGLPGTVAAELLGQSAQGLDAVVLGDSWRKKTPIVWGSVATIQTVAVLVL